MNSLIAMGASTSFMAGILSALVPGLSIDASFLEEPVMLLAFVLLGRSLEERARANASSMCIYIYFPMHTSPELFVLLFKPTLDLLQWI